MTDPIADLLTRIRNAFLAKKETVEIPFSKVKHAICNILVKEKYLTAVSIKNTKPTKTLSLNLRYINHSPAATSLKRISKPGRRIYARADKLPRPLSGQGIAIISTSQGITTDKLARQKGIGGEILCQIY